MSVRMPNLMTILNWFTFAKVTCIVRIKRAHFYGPQRSWQQCIFFIRPPVYGSNGKTYKMLVMFSLFRPPGTPFRTGLYSARDVFFFRHAFSETPQPIALKLCHMIRIWLYFIIWLQKFGGCSPKKIWGPKTCKISILDHFRLWPRISPERGNVSKIGKTYELAKFLLRLMKKIRCTLVH